MADSDDWRVTMSVTGQARPSRRSSRIRRVRWKKTSAAMSAAASRSARRSDHHRARRCGRYTAGGTGQLLAAVNATALKVAAVLQQIRVRAALGR